MKQPALSWTNAEMLWTLAENKGWGRGLMAGGRGLDKSNSLHLKLKFYSVLLLVVTWVFIIFSITCCNMDTYFKIFQEQEKGINDRSDWGADTKNAWKGILKKSVNLVNFII